MKLISGGNLSRDTRPPPKVSFNLPLKYLFFGRLRRFSYVFAIYLQNAYFSGAFGGFALYFHKVWPKICFQFTCETTVFNLLLHNLWFSIYHCNLQLVFYFFLWNFWFQFTLRLMIFNLLCYENHNKLEIGEVMIFQFTSEVMVFNLPGKLWFQFTFEVMILNLPGDMIFSAKLRG